jgi:hypothetical protein
LSPRRGSRQLVNMDVVSILTFRKPGEIVRP